MGNTNDRNAGGVVAGFVYQIYYTPAVRKNVYFCPWLCLFSSQLQR